MDVQRTRYGAGVVVCSSRVTDPYDIDIERDGSLKVGKELERFFAANAGSWRLLGGSKGLVALTRKAKTANSGQRVIIAGEISSRTTLLEMLNVVASSGWRGDLRVVSENTERGMHIDAGIVKHAHSNHVDDRLGEVMYRVGAITREQVDSVLKEVTPTRRFGAVLLERGFVTREQLFGLLQKQVEEIFFGTLLMGTGAFAFTAPDETGAPPPATVHLPVHVLLLEGVQRIDEMALFRERIPNGKLVPELKEGAKQPTTLDESGAKVFALIDGHRSVLDIARETGLGEFEATKIVYHLLTTNVASLHAGAKTTASDDEVQTLLASFNAILKDIFTALAKHGAQESTFATVHTWLKTGGHGALIGDGLMTDGTIDARQVASNIAKGGTDHPLEMLHRSLHQLAGFALFTATMALPRDEEVLLSRDVNKRLKAIRIQ